MKRKNEDELIVRRLGVVDYEDSWHAMQAFTDGRDSATADEVWLLQHPPVYTQGQAGRKEHLRDPGTIPVVRTDRGGQVTYHGPGQLIAYILFDLQRRGWGVKRLVRTLEQAIIDLLQDHAISATRRADAPGVYVNDAKIASLGLRIRRGRSYHGLSLNVAMELEPFTRIDPCGYPGLRVTQLADLGGSTSVDQLEREIEEHIRRLLAS